MVFWFITFWISINRSFPGFLKSKIQILLFASRWRRSSLTAAELRATLAAELEGEAEGIEDELDVDAGGFSEEEYFSSWWSSVTIPSESLESDSNDTSGVTGWRTPGGGDGDGASSFISDASESEITWKNRLSDALSEEEGMDLYTSVSGLLDTTRTPLEDSTEVALFWVLLSILQYKP